jgi:membrane peptidoglycan carboxypeptidase
MSAQKTKPVGALGSVLGLIGFSVVAGVLVTAMVTPALAVTSLTAKSSIGVFQNLPEFIQIGEQSQQNQIYAKQDGKDVKIASVYKQNREEVTWDNVSPFLKDAAVDGEDRRFYQHGGVDVPSVVRAAVLNQTQSQNGTSGSSTLDMQLVRNILVQQAFAITDQKKRDAAYADAIKQTVDRKLKEMKLAIGLDKRYTKKQILLGYLNIVGMGGTTYGVQAAAEQYFSVAAKDVTLPQAASLMAIVQQPNLQSLDNPKKYAANKLRRDQILAAMLSEKHITKVQYDAAVATTIESEVKLSAPTSGCRNTVPIGAAWACDYVVKLITVNPPASFPQLPPAVTALGANPTERLANWNKGGYKIYTSINLNLQAAADASLASWAPYNETRIPLGAAADTVQAGTGRVLVMAQNKIFDDAPALAGAAVDPTRGAVNFSTDQPWGGSNGFPTGSTFKVFDLANWLSTGHGLGDLVDGSGPQTYNYSSFPAACLPGGNAGGGTFPLRNDGNSSSGTQTVKQALIGSINNAFMHMAEKQDLCEIAKTAEAMGAHRADGRTYDYGGALEITPNFILGSNEQAPLTIAASGATVAANGLHCIPIIIDSVISPSGKTLPGQAPTCNQAISPEVAAGVANAMQGSMTGGTSAPGNPRDGVPYAGKTGTGNTADHVWINGLTTKLATAVWTGDIIGHASLRATSVPGHSGTYAGTSRFQIFKAIMALADTDPALRGGAFPVADAQMLSGSSSIVPLVAGQTAEQANTVLTTLGFQVTLGGTVASALPSGQVVNTSPGAGSKVPSGANVTVYTSDGSLATTMPNVVGQTKKNALTALASAGFDSHNVQVTYIGGGTAAQVCQVQGSNPAAGAAAAMSDPVTLKVYGTPVTGQDPGGTCN